MGRGAAGAVAVAIAAGALVGAVALGGCSADDDQTGAAAAADGLDASIQRATLFETHRAFALTVRSPGDREIRIRTIQLSSPRFEPVEPDERNALLRESDPRVVMPLEFGEARCGDGTNGPAELVADVDGEEVRIPLEESPADMLESLQATECAAARVFDAVDLRFGDEWQRAGDRAVEGRLELVQREGGAPAVVDELVGNVIFAFAPARGTRPDLAVSDERPSAGQRVRIHAARCDPHALIEYKRTFVFSVWVRVGDGDRTMVDVRARGPAHRALERLLAACIG